MPDLAGTGRAVAGGAPAGESLAARSLAEVPVAASRVAAELGHARYYLRRNCQPCAQRHFELARQHGATETEIGAVLAALSPVGQPG